MKFIITNAQEDSTNVIVSNTNMETQTVAHLLREIYLSNEILSKHINFETYQQIVQLSNQDATLSPHALLKDIFKKRTVRGKSVITLTLKLAQNFYLNQGMSHFDLTLVKPPVIPDDLYCPISGQVFYHPVKYHYGEKDKKRTCTVEKESLLNSATIQKKCPFTRMPLSVTDVEACVIDTEKQQQVANFFDTYKASGYYDQLKKEQYQEINLPAPTVTQNNIATEPTIDDRAAIELALQPEPNGILNQFLRIPTRNIAQPMARALNFWENNAFRNLGTYGLTAEILLNRNTNGHEFNEHHYFSLRNLVTNRGFTIQQAIAEIDGLSSQQAGGIEEGLTREDVIRLDNFWHIAALERLKSHGLTPDILLNRNANGHEFNANHCFALRNLVANRGFTIQQAIAEIDGLSRQQAGGIKEGLTREDAIRLDNVWHIAALKKLKSHGLTPDMLLNRNANGHEFDAEHYFALRNLVQQRNFTVQQALSQIEGLSISQAGQIKEGAIHSQILNEK